MALRGSTTPRSAALERSTGLLAAPPTPAPHYLLRLGRLRTVGGSHPEGAGRGRSGRPRAAAPHRGHPACGPPSEGRPTRHRAAAATPRNAEHLMLVDLAATTWAGLAPRHRRSVDFMSVERYSHVMHIVSTVVGQVAAGRTAFDVLTACFPAGPCPARPSRGHADHRGTGADPPRPLRRLRRLPDFAGDSDTAIAIRTALLRDAPRSPGRRGVVADSDPVAGGHRVPEQGGGGARGGARASTFAPATTTETR
ncbi:chorismate-binding protein [Wenjunlia vitaminophila]|uniref:chorismate-binding protein n=1 Tax=Wenjunlia vitaminophila TaxID=76728 RepID=UPI00396A4000